MARRQLQIKGTERKQNEEVEKAAQAYREARDDRMELSKREKQKKTELIIVMQSNKIKKYKFDDAEGEELLVAIDEKTDVSVRKTGEAASEVGEGLPVHEGSDGGISKGLIDQAMKAQDDMNVEENAGGDIVVPDKAAPKTKRKAKKS